ncbi:DUF4231 domain-containing protein [Streptomyces griseoincarnatus]
MSRSDLPSLYRAASDASRRGQRTHLRMTKLRLSLVIFAALSGTLSTANPLPLGFRRICAALSIASFSGALLVEVLLLRERPDRSWYGGRALAESIKTLSWKFAVCSTPFPSEMAAGEAERLFREKVRELIALHSVRLNPDADSQVTEKMNSLRASGLSERMASYVQYRIHVQYEWYSDNASSAERSSVRWKTCLLLFEVLGLIGALLVLLDYSSLDFGGVMAALTVAGVAWLEVRQFDSLAEAYALASTELSLIRDSISEVSTEESWSAYVYSAEQGISREHTMWVARRSHARNIF